MAGSTQKKPPEDAPKLPDEAQPKPVEVKAAQESDVPEKDVKVETDSDSNVEPEPEQPVPPAEIEIGAVEDTFYVKLDYPNMARASEVGEVEEGQHDPSLVEIPGLGRFRNGTRTKVSGDQLLTFQNHLLATGITEARLPQGVTIEEGGK